MGEKNKWGNPPRPEKTTLKQDVANVARALRGAKNAAIGAYGNESPASKVQDHHRRTSEEIDKMFKK